MVCLDHVEVAISRMRDEFSRGVCERHGVLLELRSKFRDLEDTKNKVNTSNSISGIPKENASVGTIGTIKGFHRMP